MSIHSRKVGSVLHPRRITPRSPSASFHLLGSALGWSSGRIVNHRRDGQESVFGLYILKESSMLSFLSTHAKLNLLSFTSLR